MKMSFTTPPFTRLGSLERIAKNVSAASLFEGAPPIECALEVERSGEIIRWRHGAHVLSFPLPGEGPMHRRFIGSQVGGPNGIGIATVVRVMGQFVLSPRCLA